MPTREELEIMLRDSITPGLRSIARELRALNQTAKESGGESASSVDKFGRSFGGVEASSSQALRSMTAMGSYVVGFGKSLLGIGGTVESIKQLTDGLNEFAENRVAMASFSQDTKFATRDIASMQQAMRMMGIETKQAQAYMLGFSGKLQELKTFREGSKLFQDLEAMPAGGTGFARKLLGDVDTDDYKKALDDILNMYKEAGPRAQIYLSQMFGIPDSVFKNLQSYQQLVEETFEGDEEKAKQFLINKTVFFSRLESEFNRFADHALTDINKVMTSFEDATKDKHFISDAAIEGWDKVSKMIGQDSKDIQAIITLMNSVSSFFKSDDKKDDKSAGAATHDWLVERAPWLSDQYIKEKLFGKGDEGKDKGAAFEERFAAVEQLKTEKENTKLLESIRDTLMKATEGAGVPGSQAATYGRGIRGGAMQAGGGGFRPRGGGRAHSEYGTKSGYSAADTPDLSNLQGSEYLKAQREPMTKELAEHPELKKHLAALLSLENEGAGPAVVESLMNRTAYVNEERRKQGLPPLTLRDMIAPDSAHSFYGPERRHLVEARLAELEKQPEHMKRLMESIDAASSSNVTQGYTDQGSAGDPNYLAGGTGVNVNRERFNLWGGGPGGHAGAAAFRERQQRAVAAAANARLRIDKPPERTTTTADVTVNFGNQDAKGQADRALAGGPFKDLKINREPQSSKAGDPADFNSRWYYQ
jgi:hypothetical protein